ncbi:hypothetical protein TraAM80_01452 [Trypanosoma rangeli]|uniref:Uncharacterized protein n=1 Tax=Trypanosoma rangeli TaxID=5698 RepID=A0A3R7KVN8_TRYRA|nr:uncharacterized protein TraAM80_01452 [Trypanosoma rangeli]RNF10636.1 hypothetical protein TraAM80_01452 [Trypanosoma rangeli]|eukprot:RNF10636.1 hypothetical protein TraAM80_01452 [Trypanosoma rangeli]
MSVVWKYDGGRESMAYSLRSAESIHDRVDAFVPPAYTRLPLPLPLQETRTHGAAPIKGKAYDVFMRRKEGLEFFLNEGEVDTKRALLEGLTGQPEHTIRTSASSAPYAADTVASRMRGSLCDASHVRSSQLMLQLVSHVLLSRTNPTRIDTACIATVDLNHTVLGAVGLHEPLFHFDAHGDPILRHSEGFCQFPDERHGRHKIKQAKLQEMALRSLALAYVTPLLWMPGGGRFQVTQLICHHCCLGDQDAKVLARILRKRRALRHVCYLEHIDLSFNNITDDGAEALKKAIKYNKCIRRLVLLGNEGIQKMGILESIQRRLKRNQEGRANWTLLQHLKWIFTGS